MKRRMYFLSVMRDGRPLDLDGPTDRDGTARFEVSPHAIGVFVRWDDIDIPTANSKPMFEGRMYFFRDAGFGTSLREGLDRWRTDWPERKTVTVLTRSEYCERSRPLKTHDGLTVSFVTGPTAPFCLLVGHYTTN